MTRRHWCWSRWATPVSPLPFRSVPTGRSTRTGLRGVSRVWLLLALITLPHRASALIAYTVSFPLERSARVIQVEIQASLPSGAASFTMNMPRWSPGDYQVVEHGRQVRAFAVSDDGAGERPLRWDRSDNSTWRVAAGGARTVLVRYRIVTTPPGNFGPNVEAERDLAFADGPALFAYFAGRQSEPVSLRVVAPQGWVVESALDRVPDADGPSSGFHFAAQDYEALADAPLLAARADLVRTANFTVGGRPHRLVAFRSPPASLGRLAEAARSIVTAAASIFDGQIPAAHYTFFLDYGGQQGGLEHRNGARIGISTSARLGSVAHILAHEYFHLWNVKRIRPRELGPFDYQNPPRLSTLWFAEGVTEYFAQLICLRSGFERPEQLLNHFDASVSAYSANPARDAVSPAMSSLRVWEEGNSSGYGGLDYYQAGELMGLCLDLAIRRESGGRKSLDDVMRLLMREHAPPRPGYTSADLASAVAAIGGPAAGKMLNQIAATTAPLPIAAELPAFGLDASFRPVSHPTQDEAALLAGWLRRGPVAEPR